MPIRFPTAFKATITETPFLTLVGCWLPIDYPSRLAMLLNDVAIVSIYLENQVVNNGKLLLVNNII